jgi:hypothetical protein
LVALTFSEETKIEESKMSAAKTLSSIFNAGSITLGAACALGGGIAAAAFGLPLAAVPVAAVAAGIGGGAASGLSCAFMQACYGGKGPEAGFKGLLGLAATHLTVVPAAAVIVAKVALNACGFPL